MAQISCFEAVGPSALLCRLQEDVFFSLIGMIMPSLCMGLLELWEYLSCGCFFALAWKTGWAGIAQGGVFMSLITISNLTFAYDGTYDNVFEDVSFQLDTNWRLGLVGRNGRGKTTFLRLLTGGLEYQGRISAGVDFRYFPVVVRDADAPARQAAEDACGSFEPWELTRELNLLGLSEEVLERPFRTLSGGEQTRLLLAAMFLGEDAFPLIDEPTNHLDREGRARVTSYLRRKDGFLLVSHDRTLLDGCIDHVLSLNRAGIDLQRGNFSDWQRERQRQDDFERAENEKLRHEIDRLDAAARRASGWSDRVERTKYGSKKSGPRPDRGYIGHKAAKMMQRSKSIQSRREKAVNEKSKLLHNIENTEALKLSPLVHPKAVLAAAQGLSISYDDRTIVKDLRFELRQGERMVITGGNGSGKTSLLRLLCGESVPYTGNLTLASNLKISLVPQTTDFLRGGLNNLIEQRGLDETLFKAILRKLDFPRVQFEKPMEQYSAGQRKKVLIAASLSEKAHLYIWDEPLNYIDVFSRMQLEELLLKFQPTLLFVEHDAAFCEKIATTEIALK